MNFGSDPEIFIIDESGITIPPIHLKLNKILFPIEEYNINHPVFYKNDKVKIIADGAAFEFNTKPTNNPEEFYNIIIEGIDALQDLLPNYKVVVSPVVKFDINKIALMQLLPLYNYACRFGCDPDIDIYSGLYSKEVNAKKIKERFGGGHLHISSDNDYKFNEYGYNPKNPNLIKQVKLFDIFIGNAFVLQSKVPNLDKSRQKYYGRPGKVRIQRYPNNIDGIEYRTPSNSWITNIDSIKLMFYAAELALKVYNLPESDEIIDKFLDISISNILNFDQNNAEKLCIELFK